MGEMIKEFIILVVIHEERRLCGVILGDIIKVDPKEVRSECEDWIHLAQGLVVGSCKPGN
jgi:hypothetical protein